MTVQHRIMSILSTLLIAVVYSVPQLSAQQSNPSTAQQPPETSQQQQPINTQPTNTQPTNTQPAQPAQTNQAQPATQQPSQPASPGTTNQGTTVNPSQAPLQPVTTYPDASDTQQQPAPNAAPQTTTTIPEGPQPKKPAEPVGAATAESVPTAGGAAAKPAGVAIAPAKQHQTRSLMIKIGAALAAGAALGTVYALSHGTSSTPPGTGLAGVTGR